MDLICSLGPILLQWILSISLKILAGTSAVCDIKCKRAIMKFLRALDDYTAVSDILTTATDYTAVNNCSFIFGY